MHLYRKAFLINHLNTKRERTLGHDNRCQRSAPLIIMLKKVDPLLSQKRLKVFQRNRHAE